MLYHRLTALSVCLATLVPAIGFAAEGATIGTLLSEIIFLLGLLLPIVFSAILLAFFWGLALFMLKTGDSEGRQRGKNLMIWGVIALFIATSLWGIVGYLQNSFEVDNTKRPGLPSLKIIK